jgi:phage terminase large subunit GpA-like protein
MNLQSQSPRDETLDFLVECIKDAYRARPSSNVWQWAEKNVYLDAKSSPSFPGYYDSSLTPYARFIQEFATDNNYREFIMMKSSQLGLTEGVLNIIRYLVANKPTNIIYAIDSKEEAKKISKTRLQPSLERCPETAVALTPNEDDFGNLTMYLRGMTLYMVGAYSAGALSNKSVGLAILDELDKHPPSPQGEADTIDLARSRLKTVNDGKLIALSTPKTEQNITYREYKTGTQHKYFVGCPHCEHRQELVWHRVKFDHCKDLTGEYDESRVEKEAYYECEKCHEPIHEKHKRKMILEGDWRQTNEKPTPGKISAHISDLYSLFEQASWGKLAVEWLRSQQSLVKLQNFFNSHLGLPWKQQQAEVKEADVMKLRGAYRRGSCPFEPCLVTMTTDKQGDVLKWSKAAWKLNGEMAIVDYGFTLIEDELLEIADLPVVVPGVEGNFIVKLGLIDEGFKTTEVRDFVVRSNGRFFPSKGRGGIQVRHTVHESKTPHKGVVVIVYHYDDDDFKKQLYISRIGKHQDILDGKSRVPRMWLPEDVDGDFVSELASEKLVEQKNNWGFSKFIWEKTGDNDFGDTVKMHLVMWHVLSPYFEQAKAA